MTVASSFWSPQWGTADAEIKVPSVENSELPKVLPLKPGVGQNIAMHASSTAMNFFLISTFPVHSTSFFSGLSLVFLALTVANTAPCMSPQRKFGHRAPRHTETIDAGSCDECPQNINRLQKRV